MIEDCKCHHFDKDCWYKDCWKRRFRKTKLDIQLGKYTWKQDHEKDPWLPNMYLHFGIFARQCYKDFYTDSIRQWKQMDI